MTTLSIDIETYSGTSLKDAGVYKYVEDPDFEILLFAYSFDGGEVKVVDLSKEDTLRLSVYNALTDPSILKTAFNANFEITCISKYFGIELDPAQWQCTMVLAAIAGLPLSLGEVSKVLNLEDQKDTKGKALLNYFSKPCKPTKANGERTRNLPQHAPEKWAELIEYCRQDVVTEMAVKAKLSFVKVTEKEKALWVLDQQINDRGVGVETQLVENAIKLDDANRARLVDEASELTGLDNPNSVAQIKQWLQDMMECDEIKSLNKEAVNKLIKSNEDPDIHELLKLRQEMGKTSVKKYAKIQGSVCENGRVKGLLQYYGANRTGRWAGRIVQMHNLPQNHLKDLDAARNLLMDGDLDTLTLCYGSLPMVLSELIRTAFIAKENHTFAVADFSAIEARVIAWLAGEKWVLDVFRTHGKIYEASAAQMFHIPIEDVTKDQRQRGKVATLALGFQGGVSALTRMDAAGAIPDNEKQGIVDLWRKTNPNIKNLWYSYGKAAIKAVKENVIVTLPYGVKFIGAKSMLFIELPSGRRLAYVRPRIIEGKYGEALQYWGTNQETKKWGLVDTYGGKIVENCLSRDTLVLSDRGWLRLTQVSIEDKLWDGLKWVSHSGLIYKGLKQTITVDGVRLTPDHKILTNGKWKDASQSEGYYRYEDTLAYRFELLRFRWQKIVMECSVRLRKNNRNGRIRVLKRASTVLWVSKVSNYRKKKQYPQNVNASSLCGVAGNAGTMLQPKAQSVVKLRWSWNISLRGMAKQFRRILAGYVRELCLWVVFGSGKQRGQLREIKLPLGNSQSKRQKQTEQYSVRNPLGKNNYFRGSRTIGNWKHNFVVPSKSWDFRKRFVLEAGRYEPVYDLKDAGDLHRFTVAGTGRPFIVHNCVQAVARDCLAETLLRLDACGYEVCLHVHDEVIVEVPIDKAEEQLKNICEIMGKEILWAKGLPLNAAGYNTKYYKKD